ncbi:hypothetical protein BX666DRAFT_642819 [Dichotomocladium elegans]|nr:hypothetical protein BX666DRAFT_642819 [Dichotomocladium elegans]
MNMSKALECQILVLLEEVVAVRPGLMRNFLYPAGKASYIQTHQGPRNRQLEESEKLAAAHSDEATSVKASRRRAQASQIGSVISNIETLEFQRAVVPDSTNTFGSVTADDLVAKLKEEFNVVIEKSQVDFKGERIKSLGEHDIIVAGHPVKVIVRAA